MGRLDIAQQTLKVAETQGVKDWKTLSAQGPCGRSKASTPRPSNISSPALQEQPDAVSVINNLALSYALDGKANKAEELLRNAVGERSRRQARAAEFALRARPRRQVRRGAQGRLRST